LAQEIKRNVELVALSGQWKERFLAKIETWESETSRTTDEQIQKLNKELANLKAKIDRINNGFADGSLDIQEFKELKNPLIPRKVELEQAIVALQKGKTNRLEPLKNWVLQANQAEKLALENDWLEMKSFLQNVGSNRLLRDQTLTVSFKKPWNLLAETVVATRSAGADFSSNSVWWNTVKVVRTMFEQENRYIYIPDLQAMMLRFATPHSNTLL